MNFSNTQDMPMANRTMSKFNLIILSFLFVLAFKVDSFAQIDQVKDGQGLVVFYRPKKFTGGAITFNIQDSEKNYGPMTNGSVLQLHLDPGTHTFFSQVISADAITLQVEEGQINYVKATVRVGYVAGRPKFNEVSEKTALKELK